jgi:hypothetical protein
LGHREEVYVNDGCESINDVLLIASLVACNAGGNVAKELGEVCDFEDLPGCDDLECLDTIDSQAGGERSIEKRSTGECVDLLQRGGVEVGEAVCQRV